MDKLFEKISKRLHERKGTSDVRSACERFGSLAENFYERYKRGDKDGAINFASYWMQWLYATGIVKEQDIRLLTREQRNTLNILYNETNQTVENGKYVIINSEVRSLGLCQVSAFGTSTVMAKDQSFITLYDTSICYLSSGIATAFSDSKVEVTGEGIVHLYDRSVGESRGTAIINLHDSSTLKEVSSRTLTKDNRVQL